MSCSKQSACAIVEFNFYRGKYGKLIVKELTVRIPQQALQQVWVFLPPYSDSLLSVIRRERNKQIQKSGVQFEWSEGEVPYDKLGLVLNQAVTSYSPICVYGTEKSRYISNLLNRPIVNIQQVYDQVEKKDTNFSQPPCAKHSIENREQCAVYKCAFYSSFLVSQGHRIQFGTVATHGTIMPVTIENSQYLGLGSVIRHKTPKLHPANNFVVDISDSSDGE